jgi:hypothetical protein
MSFTWAADLDAHRLEVHLQGLMAWAEFITFQTTVSCAPAHWGYDALVILEESVGFPDGPCEVAMRGIASRAALFNMEHAGSRVAIVAATDLGYGVMRMFLAFYEGAGGNRPTGMFRDADEARAWLDSGDLDVWPGGRVGWAARVDHGRAA